MQSALSVKLQAMSSVHSTLLVLPPYLKTDSAEELRARMLSDGDCIEELDAGEVTFIGFAGVQVLLAGAGSARRDGRSLKVVRTSAAFLQSLEWLGFSTTDLESEGKKGVN